MPPGSAGAKGFQAEGERPGYAPRDVQAEITNKIITAIESGRDTGTFQMPWQAIGSERLPVNAVTNQPYHGANVLFLSLEAEEHKWPNRWASFAQWKERGASVRKGEHGVPVVFYSPVPIHEVEEDAEGKKKIVVKTIPVFRYSTVFNIAQVDNAPLVTPSPREPVNPIEKVEQFVSATKADIRYGGDRAFYSPSSDHIQMPAREAFTGTKTSSPTEAFYSTVLHELCHWTGGRNRLNRENHNRFGDEAYAAEELIAEIGAAFSCAKLGITPELRADHVRYVASWLKILKADKRAIFTAASAATRAVEYLETLQSPEEVTTTATSATGAKNAPRGNGQQANRADQSERKERGPSPPSSNPSRLPSQEGTKISAVVIIGKENQKTYVVKAEDWLNPNRRVIDGREAYTGTVDPLFKDDYKAGWVIDEHGEPDFSVEPPNADLRDDPASVIGPQGERLDLTNVLTDNGKEVLASKQIAQDFGVGELISIWHEFKQWQKGARHSQHPERQLFLSERQNRYNEDVRVVDMGSYGMIVYLTEWY